MTFQEENFLKIVIPVSDSEELHQYQKAIINLLSKVKICECNAEERDDVRSLYMLLTHLEENNGNFEKRKISS